MNRAVGNATRLLKDDPFMAINIARSIPKGIHSKPIQQRNLFSGVGANRNANYRRLNKLEAEANASPTDVQKQATLYKVKDFFFNLYQVYQYICMIRNGFEQIIPNQ